MIFIKIFFTIFLGADFCTTTVMHILKPQTFTTCFTICNFSLMIVFAVVIFFACYLDSKKTDKIKLFDETFRDFQNLSTDNKNKTSNNRNKDIDKEIFKAYANTMADI